MAKTAIPAFDAIALTGTGIVPSFREMAIVSTQAEYDASSALPLPNPGLIPTVNIAPAVGSPDDVTFGDALVAEGIALAQHVVGSGLKGQVNTVWHVVPDGATS